MNDQFTQLAGSLLTIMSFVGMVGIISLIVKLILFFSNMDKKMDLLIKNFEVFHKTIVGMLPSGKGD